MPHNQSEHLHLQRHTNMKSDAILERIRTKLNQAYSENPTVLHTFQYNFTNGAGEIIKRVVIDCKALTVYELAKESTAAAMDAVVTMSDEDFYLVGTKVCSFDELLANGRAKVDGDADALRRMMDKLRQPANK